MNQKLNWNKNLMNKLLGFFGDLGLSESQSLRLIDEIDKGEKVVIIHKGEIVESGDVLKIVKKTKQKNIRDAFNKLVGVKV